MGRFVPYLGTIEQSEKDEKMPISYRFSIPSPAPHTACCPPFTAPTCSNDSSRKLVKP